MTTKTGKVYTPPSQKRRDSNIELYRIIAMLLIVAHHFVVNSGVMDIMKEYPTAPRSIALWLEGMWGKTGINCFVLITGWFMCKSHITARKFIKLFLEVVFYSAIINACFWITGYHDYSVKDYLMCLWPIWSISDGFVSCYLVFFLFIPFLNILVHNMTRQQHLSLVILCLVVYSVMASLPKMRVLLNYVTWFSILYFISSYMRIYPFYRKDSLRFWVSATLFSVALSMTYVMISVFLLGNKITDVVVYSLVVECNRIMAVVVGITSFLMFVNIKIPYNKFINTVAASTFGVLLIHANSDVMRQWLWQDVCDVSGHYSSPYFWVYIFAVPILIFVACIIIDHLRLRYLENPVLSAIMSVYGKGSLRLTKS